MNSSTPRSAYWIWAAMSNLDQLRRELPGRGSSGCAALSLKLDEEVYNILRSAPEDLELPKIIPCGVPDAVKLEWRGQKGGVAIQMTVWMARPTDVSVHHLGYASLFVSDGNPWDDVLDVVRIMRSRARADRCPRKHWEARLVHGRRSGS